MLVNVKYKKFVMEVINSNNINLQNSTGRTLLHFYSHNMQLVAMLLKEGANPDIMDRDSFTPLMEAIINRNWGVVKLLIQSGANLYIKNLNGESSFDLIVKYIEESFNEIKENVEKSCFLEEDLYYIKTIISLIKDIGLLSMDEYSDFVSSIYSISYEYIKLEFVYKERSELLYFLKSDEYDRTFINDFIKNDLETLSSSVNYVVGYEELKETLEKYKDEDYVCEEIFLLLSICYYSNEHKKIFNRQMLQILIKLKEVLNYPFENSEYFRDNYYSLNNNIYELLVGKYKCFKNEDQVREVYEARDKLRILIKMNDFSVNKRPYENK